MLREDRAGNGRGARRDARPRRRARYADRLIVMDGGAIAADGEPAGGAARARSRSVFGIEWAGAAGPPV
jgi:ABC-type cobalamin/Fe3+-siderophores transport system ATPase subunit